MPGGQDYLAALERLIDTISASQDTEEVLDRLMERFGLASRKAALSYLRVASTLDLVTLLGPHVSLTRSGLAYAETHSPALVRHALLERVAGTEELLAAIDESPMRMSGACEHMRTLGYDWSTQSQVRYRLRWLEAVGLVERVGVGTRPIYRVPRGSTVRSVP